MANTRSILVRTVVCVALATPSLAWAQVPASPTVTGGRAPEGVSASGQVAALDTYLRAGLSLGRAALARQADLLVRAGVARSVVVGAVGQSVVTESSSTATVSGTGVGGSLLEPVGDLNSNGVRDVLESRFGKSAADGSTPLEVFARDGDRGTVLWARRVTLAKDHFALPLGLRTGPASRAGVVLLDVGSTQSGSTVTLTLTLTGWDRTGHTLWAHREKGSEQLTSTGIAMARLPELVGIGQATAVADDLLLARVDSSTDSGGTQTSTLTPLRLNTAAGALVALGAPVHAGAVPTMGGTGDLSGDRLADVSIVSPGSGGAVETRAGNDGHRLWRSTTLTLNDNAFALPVGDVHSSAAGQPAVPELAVSTGTPPSSSVSVGPIPVPDPTAPSPHGQVALLDGSTGSTVWTKTGDFPYAVVKAGPQLAGATGVLTSSTSTANGTVTETLTLSTYDDSGTQLYTHDYSVSTPASTNSSDQPFGFGFAFPAGDFEPDGSQDPLVLLFVGSGNNSNQKQLLAHGLNGNPLGDSSADPLGASTTGHGDDLAHTTTSSRGVTVSIRRGSDDHTLFTRTLAGTSAVSSAAAYGARLHHNRCADVLVLGQGRTSAVSADLASNGQLRWMIHYAPGSLTPGTIIGPSVAPTPSCG